MTRHPVQVWTDLTKAQLALGQQIGELWQQSGVRWAALQQQLLNREMFEVKTAIVRCGAVRDWQGAAWTPLDLLSRHPQWALFAARDVAQTAVADQTELVAESARAVADWQRAAVLALGQGRAALPPQQRRQRQQQPSLPRDASQQLRRVAGKRVAANDPAPAVRAVRARDQARARAAR